MNQTTLDTIKRYYKRGIYTLADIEAMLKKKKITQAEFDYITDKVGEDGE